MFVTVGSAEWSELLKRLKNNDTTLTQLYLSYNQIGDSGAKDLSEALKENRTLTQLHLRSNQIGDSGAKAFSEALKRNCTLTLLDLNSNQIGDSRAKDLSEALKENHTLTQLDLGYNHIEDEDSNTTNSINNFLARNKDLIRKRRDQFIQAMIVLACDSVKMTSHSLWHLLPKPVQLHIISFIHFHPWESIKKTLQQISDCVAYIFDNTDALKASLKEASKNKQPFKIIEKPFDTRTNKFSFFFKPLPAQLATATTSECEKTYHSSYERQNQ